MNRLIGAGFLDGDEYVQQGPDFLGGERLEALEQAKFQDAFQGWCEPGRSAHKEESAGPALYAHRLNAIFLTSSEYCSRTPSVVNR